MRQRKIKNLDEKLGALSHLTVEDPAANRGRWRKWFGAEDGRELYVEIGCGKGKFITEQAKAGPEALFLAVEGHLSVALHALQKAEAAGVENVRFVLRYVNDVKELFEDGELDGIFLNFSDPWPKARHEKRRLTCGPRLKAYAEVLKPGGILEFKTDNDGLFEYSLEQAEALDEFIVEDVNGDLHKNTENGTIIETEYEEKFSSQGKNINFMRLRAR